MNDAVDTSLLELFQAEVEIHTQSLQDGLLDLETDQSPDCVNPLMRAAHSLKGAARIVGLELGVSLAHSMEDLLCACQEGKCELDADDITLLLEANDIFMLLRDVDILQLNECFQAEEQKINDYTEKLKAAITRDKSVAPAPQASNEVSQTIQETMPPTMPVVVEEDEEDEELEVPVVDSFMLTMFIEDLTKNSKELIQLLSVINDDLPVEGLTPIEKALAAIKGSANMIGLVPIAKLIGVMEKIIVAAKRREISINPKVAEILLEGVDMLSIFAVVNEAEMVADIYAKYTSIKKCNKKILTILEKDTPEKTEPIVEVVPVEKKVPEAVPVVAQQSSEISKSETEIKPQAKPETTSATKPQAVEKKANFKPEKLNKIEKGKEITYTKVDNNHLDKLMAYAGEAFIQINNSMTVTNNMAVLKKQLIDLIMTVEHISENVQAKANEEDTKCIEDIKNGAYSVLRSSNDLHDSFLTFTDKMVSFSNRLYDTALDMRMEPFAEGTFDFKRNIRDISKEIGKAVDLVTLGSHTPVDKDILEKLQPPLMHLLRNAIDHGIEMPEAREAAGKPRKGTITLGARHTSGYLIISVSDDGRGIDVEALRQSVVRKGFLTQELAENLSKEEIYEFLFLPRFSTKEKVTTISGRGVGLDVVFNMVHAVGGTIRVESVFGKGSTFSMQLPLSLSVINSLIVQINGELYAIPTSKIERIVHVPKTDLHYSDKKLYFKIEDMGKDVNMPLVSANTILNVNTKNTNFDDTLSVLIMGDLHSTYGVVVESVVKQLEHAVMPLSPRLGKHIPLVSAGAILEDGTPCLVIDAADMLRAIDGYFQSNLTIKQLDDVQAHSDNTRNTGPKRILVVDDSITVRELERKLLEKAGYDVTLAIDGVDGLNTAHREESFDMVISDIDMPRMDGIALVKRLRTDAKYTDIPIMIVSYKDREEDKIAGKNAGADYYLTKSSFGDDSFIQAVEDLIGKAV